MGPLTSRLPRRVSRFCARAQHHETLHSTLHFFLPTSHILITKSHHGAVNASESDKARQEAPPEVRPPSANSLRPKVANMKSNSYQLAHRIHDAHIYPVTAPNGSTLIAYGHERGVRLLWRGGRRPKPKSNAATQQTTGTSSNQDIIVIDDSDDGAQDAQENQAPAEYEDEEDEQDPDCPYPDFIQHEDIDMPSAVLHIATPSHASLQGLRLSRRRAIFAVALASGDVKILAVPLAPTADMGSEIAQVDIGSSAQPARALAVKTTHRADKDVRRHQTRSGSQAQEIEGEILVAVAASTVSIWAAELSAQSVVERSQPHLCTVNLDSPSSDLQFHPSQRSRQLLVSDAAGAVRILDLPAFNKADANARWNMSYVAPFVKSSSGTAQRKKILGSAFVLGGRGILVLLNDGAWGVWDLSGALQGGKAVGDFVISGFLGSDSGETTESSKPRKASKLAPMTPNTRKSRSENLFGGTTRSSVAPLTGGISIASNENRPGQVDESVVLWYGADVYSIQSMQQFWTRSTSNGGSSGSLYAPGLSHISDINLSNENITSISQLTASPTNSGLGQMNTQRDLVVSGEYRLIILQSLRPSAPPRQLFQQADTSRDQRRLDAGELDLGGLNRMLDGRTEPTRTRRVGFAQG